MLAQFVNTLGRPEDKWICLGSLPLNSLPEFNSRQWQEVFWGNEVWTVYSPGRFAEQRASSDSEATAADLERIRLRFDRRVPVVLTLPESICLVRRFDLNKNSLHLARQMVELDLQRILPGPIEDVASGLNVIDGGGAVKIEQIAIRRTELSRRILLLKDNGISVRAVTFRRSDGSWSRVVLDPDGAPFAARSHRQWQMTFAACVVALFTGSAAVLSSILLSNANREAQAVAAITVLESQIDTVKAKIAAYREASATYKQVRDWRSEHGSALVVINALSEKLPDHTYLSSFSYQVSAIGLDGYSRAPETLISILEGSEVLSGVSFSSPVYRDAGDEYSRVSISIGRASAVNGKP